MLNAKNLMIGDWVEIDGKIGTVSFLDKEGYINVAINETQMIVTRNPNPIPLTAEILEKNGFKFESPCISDNKDAWVYEWLNEKPNYTPHEFLLMSHHNKAKFPNFWIYAPNNPDIVYVHQLQHAFRLCGIEKEIML